MADQRLEVSDSSALYAKLPDEGGSQCSCVSQWQTNAPLTTMSAVCMSCWTASNKLMTHIDCMLCAHEGGKIALLIGLCTGRHSPFFQYNHVHELSTF